MITRARRKNPKSKSPLLSPVSRFCTLPALLGLAITVSLPAPIGIRDLDPVPESDSSGSSSTPTTSDSSASGQPRLLEITGSIYNGGSLHDGAIHNFVSGFQLHMENGRENGPDKINGEENQQTVEGNWIQNHPNINVEMTNLPLISLPSTQTEESGAGIQNLIR
jgi:hypothetical protein